MKRAVQALLRRIGYKLVRSEPSQEVLRPGPDGVIRATAWGRELVMGSDHHLPRILAGCPRFSEPIALLVKAMPQERVRFIDVGANIGDTVAMVESFSPGKCTYPCIEPDGAFLEFCRANTKSVKAVTILNSPGDRRRRREQAVQPVPLRAGHGRHCAAGLRQEPTFVHTRQFGGELCFFERRNRHHKD